LQKRGASKDRISTGGSKIFSIIDDGGSGDSYFGLKQARHLLDLRLRFTWVLKPVASRSFLHRLIRSESMYRELGGAGVFIRRFRR